MDKEDLNVLAYRFEGDKFCRAQRFPAYSEALGNRFVARVLPDNAANKDVAPLRARCCIACLSKRPTYVVAMLRS
jgi:hypothetical protein